MGFGTQTFTCWVGVVPRLDCEVLIGRDCPILAQLLQDTPKLENPSVLVFQVDPAREANIELVVQIPDLAHFNREDQSLCFPLKQAVEQTPPPTAEPMLCS